MPRQGRFRAGKAIGLRFRSLEWRATRSYGAGRDLSLIKAKKGSNWNLATHSWAYTFSSTVIMRVCSIMEKLSCSILLWLIMVRVRIRLSTLVLLIMRWDWRGSKRWWSKTHPPNKSPQACRSSNKRTTSWLSHQISNGRANWALCGCRRNRIRSWRRWRGRFRWLMRSWRRGRR